MYFPTSLSNIGVMYDSKLNTSASLVTTKFKNIRRCQASKLYMAHLTHLTEISASNNRANKWKLLSIK
jgi:hypothetical protein